MKLVKFNHASGQQLAGCLEDEVVRPIPLDGHRYRSLSDLLETDDPMSEIGFLVDQQAEPFPLAEVTLLAPIDRQEVWAAGVTYRRSKAARMEESESAASCYDRVYEAARPELFFKADPRRVSGPGEPVRIRRDSNWDVPEPELTLVLNSRLGLVGFTVGNDMSSREIEGENPLYLPQAKVYDACCSLGPCITLAERMPSPADINIEMVVHRDGAEAFSGSTSVENLTRSYEDLIDWLGRESTFPNGAFLMTGTGVVPDSDFTLRAGDVVVITVDGVGTLSNPVIRG